ncbi:hypothetical protein BD408DRAFT_321495, partial [Parasitella parasitica]
NFANLRNVNGVLCDSYKQACMLMHLLKNDEKWRMCFHKTNTFPSGSSLHSLF